MPFSGGVKYPGGLGRSASSGIQRRVKEPVGSSARRLRQPSCRLARPAVSILTGSPVRRIAGSWWVNCQGSGVRSLSVSCAVGAKAQKMAGCACHHRRGRRGEIRHSVAPARSAHRAARSCRGRPVSTAIQACRRAGSPMPSRRCASGAFPGGLQEGAGDRRASSGSQRRRESSGRVQRADLGRPGCRVCATRSEAVALRIRAPGQVRATAGS